MKKKLKLIVPLALLIVGGGLYKTVLAKPTPAPKPKIEGEVYVLGKDFLVNLAGGQFAKLGVALVIERGTAAEAGAGAEAGAKPPEGYGTMPQEAAVRDIVTDTLTDTRASELTGRKGRSELKELIKKRIEKSTDVKAEDVLFTDVSVQ